MCLIAVAWRVHPAYPLALIANRDEFHGRPTAPAETDPEAPAVFGGRDLQAGGSWLQVSRRGRLAAVTNVRAGLASDTAPRSRGRLVRDFVRGDASTDRALAALAPTAAEYGRFNLLFWDGATLGFAGNHPHYRRHAIAPGLHAMSNGEFDAPWPKSTRATRALDGWLASPGADAWADGDASAVGTLFDALADRTPAPDDELPDTGVGLDLERMLSPPFVLGERYGTRCSTVVLIGARGIAFAERQYGPGGVVQGQTEAMLEIDA